MRNPRGPDQLESGLNISLIVRRNIQPKRVQKQQHIKLVAQFLYIVTFEAEGFFAWHESYKLPISRISQSPARNFVANMGRKNSNALQIWVWIVLHTCHITTELHFQLIGTLCFSMLLLLLLYQVIITSKYKEFTSNKFIRYLTQSIPYSGLEEKKSRVNSYFLQWNIIVIDKNKENI